ncbi:response regulator transcription factor [Paenibacillus sp. SC116]|uniref:response regulator transcription factor n=1 Tax=Paenibacillus sp. SC116 TaxID=2968986 RepID=UPI00215B499F|nr:response regulator transcription factor [Paenibacillus sp. SC116]MCR8844699.1 response regulator transcription factor [Paenibacillus sp. SC116]
MFEVFLVDDEPFIIEGLQSILEWNDYGLTIVGQAENGEAAWQALQERPVDLVVTDIMMPKMTGLQLIERMKHTHPHTRFIILSGYNEFGYVKEGIKLGVENYLLKPINLEEFRATLETTVQKMEQSRSSQLVEQHNRDILRENVLYRWVRDQIHMEELQQRADMLDLQFKHAYYWTVLVRMEGEYTPDIQQIQQEQLWFAANEFMRSFEYSFIVREWDGEVVFVFGLGDEQADKELLLGALKSWKQEMEQKLGGIPLQVTTGSIQAGYTKAAQSYAHAKQLQPYHLVRMDENILDYEEAMRYRSSRPSSLQPDIESYVRLLYAKNREHLHEQLEQDFLHLTESDGAEPRDVHNFAVELLMVWKQSIKETAIQLPVKDIDWFSEVYRLHSLDAIREHVAKIADHLIDLLTQPQDMSPVVKQVLQHMEERYAEELSLKTLSQVYNINPVYLGQLFQKEMNGTFSDYLNKTRIKNAKRLLIETHYRMTEIAEKVGYWDKSYFYKQFKKYVGTSPKEYREMRSGVEQELRS